MKVSRFKSDASKIGLTADGKQKKAALLAI